MTDDARPPGIRRLLRLGETHRAIRCAIQDEIRFHIESRAEDLVARGLTPDAARRQAGREFGDLTESLRELADVDRRRLGHERREERLMSLIQDLRYAVRGLVRRPALTIVAVLALTIGIGANAVMFGVVDQLMLRPPPGVTGPDGVRRIYYRATDRQHRVVIQPVNSYAAMTAIRESVPGFSDVAGYFRTTFTLGHGRDAERVDAELVSGNYFRLLGVRPQLGRTFTPDEDAPPDGARVAVVSDGFWRRALGAESAAVGRQLELNGNRFTIVGVAPPGFGDLDRRNVDLWVPVASAAAEVISDHWNGPNAFWIRAIGRLRIGADPALVAAQATAAYRNDEARLVQPGVDSTAEVVLGPLVGAAPGGASADEKVSLWLMGVSAIVLLIACANVANLLIARTLDRRREIAVRLALGVSRGRLLRQMLTESTLLAGGAALAALVVTHWGAQVVQRVLLPGIVWSGSVIDVRVLAFTLIATVACILLCGLAPAVQGARADAIDGLKASARQVAGSRGRLRTGLLCVQAALSVLLLIGAGLFVKSLRQVAGRDVGITLDRTVLVTMNLERAGFAAPRIREMFATGAERIRAVPGVEQAAVVAQAVPLLVASGISIRRPGVDRPESVPGGGPYYGVVQNDFFAATGARITAGRSFTPAEEHSPSRVLIVNELLAHAYWPERSPVGDCVRLGTDATCSVVVGVVQNVLLFSMVNDDRAMIYIPPSHPAFGAKPPAAILVRTAGDPAATVPLIRSELQRLSPTMPYVGVSPYIDLVAPQLRPWRLGATMFTLFGGIALAIATIGLYSAMAYWVSQRRHEIGVRLALGAQRGDVVRLVAIQASRPIVAGLVLGVVAAALAARWVTAMLYNTSAHDPWVYGGAAVALAITALAACVVPARRSASVDPAGALRAE